MSWALVITLVLMTQGRKVWEVVMVVTKSMVATERAHIIGFSIDC